MTESTDRELIELAAKAAGYGAPWYIDGSDCPYVGEKYTGGATNYRIFNPLESDADAFRLAVELGIDVHTGDTFGVSGSGFTTADCFSRGRVISMLVPHGDDPYAATRRAITRAAAEIGRKM